MILEPAVHDSSFTPLTPPGIEMGEIPGPWLPILRAIRSGPVAWMEPGEVATATGGGVEETLDTLASLDVAGWIDVWERPDGPVVTLTALGAERLGVHLVEVGPGEVPRWAAVGDPEPVAVRARHVCATARAAEFDYLPDPLPTPDVAAERAEEARGRDGTGLPLPRILLGQGLSPWPGPGPRQDPACPACGSLRLGPVVYCLCCDRWGLDGQVVPCSASLPMPAVTRRRRPVTPAADEARRRAERVRRKDRRRARRVARQAPPSLRGGVLALTP